MSTDEELAEQLDEEDLHELEDLQDPEDEDDAETVLAEDEEETDQASLEELLAARAASRKGADDSEDGTDIMALASQRAEPVTDPVPARAIPLKDRQEFVCANCHLVKPRVQLADTARNLCRDCA